MKILAFCLLTGYYLFMAGVGFMSYFGRQNPQVRDEFWKKANQRLRK
jgi:hypothetical protein